MLKHRIVEAVAAQPGITTRELRDALPDASRSGMTNALQELRRSGAIETADRCGRYRVPERRPSPAGYTPAMLARLMAGR